MSLCLGDISVGQQIVSSSVGALMTSIIVTPMATSSAAAAWDHLCLNCEEAATSSAKIMNKCEWFNRPGHFTGTVDALVKITRHEGIRSLWSGLSPTMLSAIPATVFYFTVYDNTFCYLRDRMPDHIRFYAPLISGSFARTVAVTVVSPLELDENAVGEAFILRTQKCNQKNSRFRRIFSALPWMVSHLDEGHPILGLDIVFFLVCIYWTGYEFFKARALKFAGLQKTNFTISFLCGASAGTIAALLTIPFDVVKTHQQITLGQTALATSHRHPAKGVGKGHASVDLKVKSATQIMKELVKTKGVSSLFAGLVPRVVRVAPACAIMIGSYEYLKLFFSHQNARKRDEKA